MTELFEGEPTGKLDMPTLQDAIERITRLEDRLARLREELKELNSA